jgi:hypothetical protein
LFLYALKNTYFIAEPYLSIYAYSENGSDWSDFQTVPGVDGWLFWRPKTQDGVNFYNSAYWWEHGNRCCCNPGMASNGRSSPLFTRASETMKPRSIPTGRPSVGDQPP